jgi:hypothetical protein
MEGETMDEYSHQPDNRINPRQKDYRERNTRKPAIPTSMKEENVAPDKNTTP